MKTVKTSLVILVFFTIITGAIYPLVITGAGRLLFKSRSGGSIMYRDGKVAGSVLIGQRFTGPGYFHGRPSAVNYDATVSGGSNLGPSNKKLAEDVKARAGQVMEENSLAPGTVIPADLLFASGSGLDPHISLDAALLQAGRVAAARKVDVRRVVNLVMMHVEKRYILFGDGYVNVFMLNIAIDADGGIR